MSKDIYSKFLVTHTSRRIHEFLQHSIKSFIWGKWGEIMRWLGCVSKPNISLKSKKHTQRKNRQTERLRYRIRHRYPWDPLTVTHAPTYTGRHIDPIKLDIGDLKENCNIQLKRSISSVNSNSISYTIIIVPKYWTKFRFFLVCRTEIGTR